MCTVKGEGGFYDGYYLGGWATPCTPTDRHNGGANVVFADGHVEWKERSALENDDLW